MNRLQFLDALTGRHRLCTATVPSHLRKAAQQRAEHRGVILAAIDDDGVCIALAATDCEVERTDKGALVRTAQEFVRTDDGACLEKTSKVALAVTVYGATCVYEKNGAPFTINRNYEDGPPRFWFRDRHVTRMTGPINEIVEMTYRPRVGCDCKETVSSTLGVRARPCDKHKQE